MLIRLGQNNYDSSRYAKMKRKGTELLIFFDKPREVVKVVDEGDIIAAIEEVKAAMREKSREEMGGGWVGDEED